MTVQPIPDVERIIDEILRARPDVRCEQLEVCHPGADDDGLWFFYLPGETWSKAQIESSHGVCPFIVEGAHCRTGRSIEEVVRLVLEELDAARPTA